MTILKIIFTAFEISVLRSQSFQYITENSAETIKNMTSRLQVESHYDEENTVVVSECWRRSSFNSRRRCRRFADMLLARRPVSVWWARLARTALDCTLSTAAAAVGVYHLCQFSVLQKSSSRPSPNSVFCKVKGYIRQ